MNPHLIQFPDGTTIRADLIAAIGVTPSYMEYPDAYRLTVQYAVGTDRTTYEGPQSTRAEAVACLDELRNRWAQALGIRQPPIPTQ